MSQENIVAAIRAFFEKYIRDDAFENDEDVFAAGLVNSLMAMQLVMFVEKEFQIAVADDDLDMENFRSVDRVAAFVQKKAQA